MKPNNFSAETAVDQYVLVSLEPVHCNFCSIFLPYYLELIISKAQSTSDTKWFWIIINHQHDTKWIDQKTNLLNYYKSSIYCITSSPSFCNNMLTGASFFVENHIAQVKNWKEVRTQTIMGDYRLLLTWVYRLMKAYRRKPLWKRLLWKGFSATSSEFNVI